MQGLATRDEQSSTFESRREKVKAIAIAAIEAALVASPRQNESRAIVCSHPPGGLHASSRFFPGGYTEEVTPVPIPNTEVKLFRANGTVGATLWESRTLPGF